MLERQLPHRGAGFGRDGTVKRSATSTATCQVAADWAATCITVAAWLEALTEAPGTYAMLRARLDRTVAWLLAGQAVN
jgi:hypothetical protein